MKFKGAETENKQAAIMLPRWRHGVETEAFGKLSHKRGHFVRSRRNVTGSRSAVLYSAVVSRLSAYIQNAERMSLHRPVRVATLSATWVKPWNESNGSLLWSIRKPRFRFRRWVSNACSLKKEINLFCSCSQPQDISTAEPELWLQRQPPSGQGCKKFQQCLL